jgi:hypothetical protein
MQPAEKFVPLAPGQFHLAPQPDVIRVPRCVDDSSGVVRFAKTALAFLPDGRIKISYEPIVGRF